MFHVEKMHTADLPFAVDLANTMDWSMTTDDFNFNATLETDGCFVLFDDQRPVGIATCISYGQVGWFGNFVVSEAHRTKGAGTLLVKHVINYLKNTGVKAIGLYTYPHLLGFYGKLGFKQDTNFVVLKAKTITSSEKVDAKRVTHQDLSKLVDFDRRHFGASREKLLAQILAGKDNLCYVSTEEDKVVGYVAAKVSGRIAEIGPLICSESHREVAVDLLKAVFSKLPGTKAFMYLEASENSLLKTSYEAGFQERFQVARMFLGSRVAEECVYMAESLERG